MCFAECRMGYGYMVTISVWGKAWCALARSENIDKDRTLLIGFQVFKLENNSQVKQISFTLTALTPSPTWFSPIWLSSPSELELSWRYIDGKWFRWPTRLKEQIKNDLPGSCDSTDGAVWRKKPSPSQLSRPGDESQLDKNGSWECGIPVVYGYSI